MITKQSTQGLYAIPTNLIMGFLGVGKTTTILNLLKNKPENEKWAVLVNEFGSVGIDGAIYSAQDTFVKEIPGGCMCCAVGVPLQVAVNRLLREAKPDRLLIEPSGLGHPRRILDTLNTDYFKDVLKILASICLVDPRKLNDSRYTSNENFIDQIALADVLIANKTDLSDLDSLQQFNEWGSRSQPAKSIVSQSIQGQINSEWLNLPRNPDRKPVFPHAHSHLQTDKQQDVNTEDTTHYQRLENSTDSFQSCGWIFPKDTVFNFCQLNNYIQQISAARLKGIFATEKGWFIFNCSDGLLTVTKTNSGNDSRVEFILERGKWDEIEKRLKLCIQ